MNACRTGAALSALLLGITNILLFTSAVSASEQQILYFPQFADGGEYTTTWYFTGYGSGPSAIDVEIFDKAYRRLSLVTDQGTGNTFHLSLNGYGSTSLRTLGGGGSLKTGWVRVTSSPPVGATETYKYVGSNGLLNQASVLPSSSLVSATLLVADARSSALALLNSLTTTSTVTFRLRDENGDPAGSSSSMSLQPGNQLALFVNQIPGFESVTSLNGSIEISASSQFFLTTLVFEGQNFATLPVLDGRSVLPDSRGSLVNQFNLLIGQTRSIGDQLLPPPSEDLALFADFLSHPQTGLIRLLPREIYDGYLTIRGGGAYYSFSRLTHEYGYGSDIELAQGHLSVGFAGADFGFLTNLGDVPIDGITLDTPAVQYLASFNAPLIEADARAQYQRAGMGFSVGDYYYRDYLGATASTTFALRSICYDESDVLVAFRIVRMDTDGSAIVVWKILQTFAVPKLQ